MHKKATNTFYLKSEALEMVSYDEVRHELKAKYANNNNIYLYQKVPLKKWRAFAKVITAGKSAGEFINKEVKPFYPFERVE